MRLQLNDKRVLVLGLGDTGLSALRWLQRRGALLSAADTRETPPGLAAVREELPGVKVHLGPFRREAFEMAEIIVASPGVSLAEPEIQAAIARGVPVVGDVELFAQYKPAHSKVIAITGANGKSTVTALTGAMCEEAGLKTVVAGNIGLPVLDVLDMPVADVYVLELSSFQLETMASLAADAATVLNVTEDHMDRYAGMAEYAAAKARIFHGQGVQVLNREDEWSRNMALPGRQQVSFGTDAPPAQHDFGLRQRGGELWLAQGDIDLMKAGDMPIAGRHNAANALAALTLCRAVGLEYPPLLAALRAFRGLPHRVEWVAEIGGVAFYDDSKGTNVGATCAALAGLPQKVVLIAGGDGKGQDFSPLFEPVAHNARAVVLIGRDGPQIGRALASAGVPVLAASNMEQAVRIARQAAQAGDAVLLSPACASFDMFRNYAHRAEVFITAVQQLAKEAA
ncbi:MAG TPA: UDP-N-acetylmuramoyl-L-alanine--D-glutamate ligase [Novimethylophilus sp.]|jgi:UDP-N-acetylmuramoylalanine--D-glutamate ligase|uniref:UDP-N-acetylmuramoyl-L-alanine--D-glutamate ligase n=1 Tax=Novimethylophilus sp. TaxID=2137426 RepID=UPI002F4156DC